MTDQSCLSAPPAVGESQAVKAGYHSTEDGVEANRQRRTIQNRKNQRAHRLRTKEQGSSTTVRKSRPFQVVRWRLDTPDDLSDTKGTVTSPMSNRPTGTHSTSLASTKLTVKASAVALKQPHIRVQANLTPPPILFPLSTDHLLHLVQYNVFRAFVSNKRTLNLLLTGWTEAPPSPTSCPISGPYRDDTSVFPLNPNIPAALAPTLFQQTHPHPIWINLIPFPRIRDNLIRRQGKFDTWGFLQDLIGELMGANQFQTRQATPATISVSDPEPHDEDAVTKGRKGLVVWGEPHEMQNWEATPGFFASWPWAVEGCSELLEHSNRWRLLRGEEPIGIFFCP